LIGGILMQSGNYDLPVFLAALLYLAAITGF
jgi:hypothetical protein